MESKEELSPEEINEGLNKFIWTGALTTVMTSFMTGAFLTGFALLMGASDFQIGLLSSLPLFASLTQLSTEFILKRIGNRKKLCLYTLGASRLIRITFILLPIFFGWLGDTRAWVIIFVLTISAGFGSIGSISWFSWIADLVPLKRRGRYFSTRNVILVAIGLVAGVLAGRFIDLWKQFYGVENPYGFVILYGIGLFWGIYTLFIMRDVPEPLPKTSSRTTPFLQTFLAPFWDSNFRRFIIFRSFWAFAVGFAAPFFAVFMIKYLEVPYSWIAIFMLINKAANLYSQKFWGKISDKFGNKPVVAICTFGKCIYPLMWLFVTPANCIPLISLIYLSGLFDSGLGLGASNLMLATSPRESKAMYLSSYTACVNVAAAISPILGGLLAQNLGEFQLNLFLLKPEGLQILFLISGILRLFSFLFFRSVSEEHSKSLGHMLRVFQRIRRINPRRGLAYAFHFWIAPMEDAITTAQREGKAMLERGLGRIRREDRNDK